MENRETSLLRCGHRRGRCRPGISRLSREPTREPLPIADEEFSGVCSFTVARQVLVTGEFIDVNSSGPILLDFHADGSLTETDWGRQFERPPGQLLLTTGPVVWEFDSAGNFVSFTQRGGTTQDVCVLLG